MALNDGEGAKISIASGLLFELMLSAFRSGKNGFSESDFVAFLKQKMITTISEKSTNGQPVALQQDASLPAGGVPI